MPAQRQIGCRRGKGKLGPAERRHLRDDHSGVVAKRVGAHPLLPDTAEIDISDRHLRLRTKPLGFGEVVAYLENTRLAVPGEVGGRFTRTGSGIGVSGEATCRL